MADVEKSQSEKFKDLARKVNADESEEAFDESLKRLTRPENQPIKDSTAGNKKRTKD